MYEAEKHFDGLISGVITVDDINNAQTLKLIKSQLLPTTNELQSNCTSRLWTQYMRNNRYIEEIYKSSEHRKLGASPPSSL